MYIGQPMLETKLFWAEQVEEAVSTYVRNQTDTNAVEILQMAENLISLHFRDREFEPGMTLSVRPSLRC